MCSIVLHNGPPISITPPNHVVLRVDTASPHEGQHGHERHQALQGRHRRRVPLPRFVNIGDLIKIDTRTGEYWSG